MHKKMLIRLWIAEGFIAQTQEGKAKETMELEDEAELMDRSMIQVGKNERFRDQCENISDACESCVCPGQRAKKVL